MGYDYISTPLPPLRPTLYEVWGCMSQGLSPVTTLQHVLVGHVVTRLVGHWLGFRRVTVGGHLDTKMTPNQHATDSFCQVE